MGEQPDLAVMELLPQQEKLVVRQYREWCPGKAILYSLVETAKANGLVSMYYLHRILQKLPENQSDIDRLLPWAD